MKRGKEEHRMKSCNEDNDKKEGGERGREMYMQVDKKKTREKRKHEEHN